MKEFLLFSSLIYGSLFVGWALRKLFPALERKSRLLSRFTMIAIETPTILLVYWEINRLLLRTYFPVAIAALVVLSASGVVGYVVARIYQRDRAFTGTYVVSSMFSNNGATLGGFLCLLYLGDEGLVVSQLFLLLALPYYFTVVFTVARRFSDGEPMGIWKATKINFGDPVAILPIIAVVAGLTLGLSGVGLPEVLELPRRVLVFTAVILFSISFGLTARVRRLLGRMREYIGILPVKFIVAPLIGIVVALLFGYGPSSTPLGFKVIVIQSTMPVAIWSVVASKLFRLDEQLAVGLWIFTTVCVAALLPVVGWVASL